MAEKTDAEYSPDPQPAFGASPVKVGRRRFLTMLSLAAGALAMAPVVMRQGSAFSAADATGKRTILITGSTSGMGRRLAERLASPGTTILVHGRNRQRGEEVLKAVEDAGGTARFYAADFSSLADVRNLADAVIPLHVSLNSGAGCAPESTSETRRIPCAPSAVAPNPVAPDNRLPERFPMICSIMPMIPRRKAVREPKIRRF